MLTMLQFLSSVASKKKKAKNIKYPSSIIIKISTKFGLHIKMKGMFLLIYFFPLVLI